MKLKFKSVMFNSTISLNDDDDIDVEGDLEADEDTVEVEELGSPHESSGAPATQVLILHLGTGYTGDRNFLFKNFA